MKTTVELPDELFRRAKVVAALRGRKLKHLVEEGLRYVLESPVPESSPYRHSPTVHELMQSYCGIVDSGVSDLATNPDYMTEFGVGRTGDC